MGSDLKGKTALVTGGARGIGHDISAALAGSNVVIHARNVTDAVRSFAEDLAAEHGVRTYVVTADFLKPDGVDQLFAGIAAADVGPLDILINNAGFETTAAAEDMPVAEWQAVIDVNLNAPFRCSQHAAWQMIEKGGGVIINITSIHDSVPRKGLAHYCAAKAALKMLGHCTALEWAEHGIRVIGVGPGAIETDMNREAIEGFGRDKFEGWIPVGRLGNTGDIAETVRFLCSDAASYITATDIYVDGGYMKNLVRYDDRPDRRG
ncbi:SDR family oxidoreductase [Martelella mediterranea]|uniref:SDR family NAD(P)-dependent oxidoreductase n=1 Tax=Martelella mediterranea TaxID=293089 RepID=UPI001E39284B|nr:SDR family NAD(P)-dependent oxidoreductase [Martelella mediterranea]MCD1635783.1 SDR family oxidoreductase [Martelella mediterranea]